MAGVARRVSGVIACWVSLGALVACGSSFQGVTRLRSEAETRKAAKVPDFAGTASPILPAASCPSLLPPDLSDPFDTGDPKVRAADYQRTGCWTGVLEGKKFILIKYFSTRLGGGLAVSYGGKVVGRILTGSGPPTIIRFSGVYVCDAEQAGAYFVALDLRTGLQMEEEMAQRICPPRQWPPAYVLGLGKRRFSIAWPGS